VAIIKTVLKKHCIFRPNRCKKKISKNRTYIERLSRLPHIQGRLSFRYSQLCGPASDAVDAVRSAIPKGFKFQNLNLYNSLKTKDISSPFKI
jgi:hypothetical protein